jgi:hypothetical protein
MLVGSEWEAAGRLGGSLEKSSTKTLRFNCVLNLQRSRTCPQGSNIIATASGFQRQLSFSIASLVQTGLSANFPANFARFENLYSAGLTRRDWESSENAAAVVDGNLRVGRL